MKTLPSFDLPAGVQFNGFMELAGDRLLIFTERDTASPSHGTTFAVNASVEPSSIEAVIYLARERKRDQFEAGRAILDRQVFI